MIPGLATKNKAVKYALTQWGLVMHICVSNLSIIGSHNGCRLVGAKPLSEPMTEYCYLDP